MSTQISSIVIFQAAAFFGALGQLLYKKSTAPDMARRAAVSCFLAGMFIYIGVTLLFVLAYRLGGNISVLYPTYAATFVWSLVLARIFFGENITIFKIVGTLCVIGGIGLVTL